MRKYEGIEVVCVCVCVGLLCDPSALQPGAGNPHTVSVTPDRHQWSLDDLINLSALNPLPSVLWILQHQKIPTHCQRPL